MQFDAVISIAREAGAKIMEVYNGPGFGQTVDWKSDNSPLTQADRIAHEVIEDMLIREYPEIPLLSEEGAGIDYALRKNWERFWLVDPLDGTREFINRRDEFTVNIALVESGFPVFGLIHAPASQTTYLGDIKAGRALRISAEGETALKVGGRSTGRVAVRSRSHASDEEEAVLGRYGVREFTSIGSALKFCLVAEGRADLYYRHGPTMEWDTAAGQAIVEAAGGKVLQMPSEERFVYNKENLRNGSFLVLGF
jgi:3'(2'), 5'-bisphosphate nucleotidase